MTEKHSVDELSRTYTYPDGATVHLENVFEVIVRDSGTHRVRTMGEHGPVHCHVIPAGWVHLDVVTSGGDWDF